LELSFGLALLVGDVPQVLFERGDLSEPLQSVGFLEPVVGVAFDLDPAQRARLADIRDNLIARIAEAEREGWLGEVEGLQVSLAGAQDKLTQLDAEATRRSNAVSLGMPTLGQIALSRRETKGPSPTAD
jgi:hypothetical protein